MNFGMPAMLLMLPPLLLVAWLVRRARRFEREAAHLLQGAVPQNVRGFLRRQDLLVLAALICIVVAMSRPQWNPRPYDVERRGRDLIIALDVSRSMLASDIPPSRLEMARIAVHETLPLLAGQRVALVTFSGSAAVRVPLTLDHGFVRYMLDRADPSDADLGSTSLQAAFEKVKTSVLSDAGGRRDLVMFTDGEDHLSDLEKTGRLLAQFDARVLIIGLGDPVRGAPVPDTAGSEQRMQYNGQEVVSRLQEGTLTQLAEQNPNVDYFPARTRPFDLALLYLQLIADASDDVVVGELRQVRYSEGYPYLLAMSVVLLLAATQLDLRRLRVLVLLVLVIPGCGQAIESDGEAMFRARFRQGSELLKFAEEQSGTDPAAERSLLVDAREQYLRAALLRPGDADAARQITSITQRLREVQKVIEQQRAEEQERREKLSQTIQRLERITQRQQRISERSRRVLRRRPALTEEQMNLPDPPSRLPQAQLNRLAPPVRAEQQAVREATSGILDSMTQQRDALREILSRAYGNIGRLPATEVDPVVNLLTETVAAQDQAMECLAAGAVRWPRANTAVHTAAGRMQQALDALRGLQPPKSDEDEAKRASRNKGRGDQDMEQVDSETRDNNAQPMSPGDFQEALSLRSLPIPNYSSSEILAEEAANQQKRSRQKAARAGAKVEKNW
jgi:hypothetical protein